MAMADSNTMPSAALPFAIFVLVYSLINVLASALVVFMQWRHSNRLSCAWTTFNDEFLS